MKTLLKRYRSLILVLVLLPGTVSLQAAVVAPPPVDMPIEQPLDLFASNVRAVHLSPDAPAVDIYANGSLVVSGLEFAQGTEFLRVPAGSYDFVVTPAGANAGDGVLKFEGLDLGADRFYTAVAYGFLEDIRGLTLEDSFTRITTSDVELRVIHTATDIGLVDVWLLPLAGAPTLMGKDLAYGEAGEYVGLDAVPQVVGIDVDGDTVPDLVYDIPALPAGSSVNVFVVNDGDRVVLMVQLTTGDVVRLEPRAGQSAYLRVLHLSPDTPMVDVYIDQSILAAESLTFLTGTRYLELPSDVYRFDVVESSANVGRPLLTVDGIYLAPGHSYTAVAYDLNADIKALAIEDDFDSSFITTTKIRIAHTAAGVGKVSIGVMDTDNWEFMPLMKGFGFGEVSDYIQLTGEPVMLGIDGDADGYAEWVYQMPRLGLGEVATIFAVRKVSPGDNTCGDADCIARDKIFLVLQLRDGDTLRINPKPFVSYLRVIHLSSDVPDVDLWLDGRTVAVSGLAFTESTGYLELQGDLYDLDLAPAGAGIGASVFNLRDMMFFPDRFYTAVIFGEAGRGDLQVLFLNDSHPGLSQDVSLSAIHTAYGIGPVDIMLVTPRGRIPLWRNLAYGAAGTFMDLVAKNYTIGLDVNHDRRADLLFDVPALPPGTVANVFAVSERRFPIDGSELMGRNVEGVRSVFLLAQLMDGTTVRIDARKTAPELGSVHSLGTPGF
ncbi:DUF4397 domain-containing protein [bacterium]|nr:DUF4397 domain-containing protein [candidate division CSSED10-310 bacterium]